MAIPCIIPIPFHLRIRKWQLYPQPNLKKSLWNTPNIRSIDPFWVVDLFKSTHGDVVGLDAPTGYTSSLPRRGWATCFFNASEGSDDDRQGEIEVSPFGKVLSRKAHDHHKRNDSQPSVTITFHRHQSPSDPAQNDLRGWAILAQTGEETWQHRCHIERGVLRGHLAGRCGFHHHAVPDQWLGLRYGEHMRGTGFQKALT